MWQTMDQIREMLRKHGVTGLESNGGRNRQVKWGMLVPKGPGDDRLKPQLNVIEYLTSIPGTRPHVAVRLEIRGCLTAYRKHRPLPVAARAFLALDSDRMTQLAAAKNMVFRVWHPDELLTSTPDFAKMKACVEENSPDYNAMDMARIFPSGSLDDDDFTTKAFEILHFLYTNLQKDLFHLSDYD